MIKDTMLVLKEHLGNYHLLEDEEISRESIVDLIFILEKNIKDVRVAGRCTFRLADVVVIIFLAVLSGCSNCSEFAWFAKIRYPLLEKLGLVSGEVIPSHDTFRRILLLIDPVELEKSIYEELDHFFQQVEKQFNVEGKYIHMAIDGKELRGTGRSQQTQAPQRNLQTLNVYNCSRSICLYSTSISRKTNEIPVAQQLLSYCQLRRTIVSADALHSQVETARLITERQGYYLFNIKDNQPLLKEEIIRVFGRYPKKIRIVTESSEQNNDPKEARSIEVIKLWDSYIGEDWPNQRNYVRYYSARQGQLFYFLTSIRENEAILEAVLSRWKIENDLHRHKDLLLQEDQIRYINRNIANNLALMNNLALAFINIAQGIGGFETKKFTRKALVMDGNTLPFKVIKLAGSKCLIQEMRKLKKK